MDGLQREFAGRVDVFFYNTDHRANWEMARQYNVRAIPVLVLLDGAGRTVNRWTGLAGAGPLRSAIQDLLAHTP